MSLKKTEVEMKVKEIISSMCAATIDEVDLEYRLGYYILEMDGVSFAGEIHHAFKCTDKYKLLISLFASINTGDNLVSFILKQCKDA